MRRLGRSVNSEMLGCQQLGMHLGLVLPQQARTAKCVFGTLAAKEYVPPRMDKPCLGITAPLLCIQLDASGTLVAVAAVAVPVGTASSSQCSVRLHKECVWGSSGPRGGKGGGDQVKHACL